MQEQQSANPSTSCSCEAEMIAIDKRLQVIEHSHDRMREAFVQNDLGRPDYEGHRIAHKNMMAESAIVDTYKQSAAKSIIAWVLAALLGAFSLGAIEWIRGHLK